MGQEEKQGSRDIGRQFQDETKYSPETISGYTLNYGSLPAAFKEYSDPIARISLPEPKATGETNIWKLLLHRRSRREYDIKKSLRVNDLSALIWATQGLTAQFGDDFFRTAPSAGGLYPVETYLYIRSVEGLDEGIYHFRPGDFDLEFIRKGHFARELTEAALQQDLIAGAQVTFIWSAIVARGKWKYKQRAYRYIYMDAGHIAQNLYLAAEGMGFGVCAIGAFYDDEVNRIMGFDGIEETVIYMATVGHRSPGSSL